MATITIFEGWNEAKLKEIARDCDNKQIVKDVGYFQFLNYHKSKGLFCEYTQDSFCIGKLNKDHFRIIGMGTRTSCRRKGLAIMHLRRVFQTALNYGVDVIKTRTLSGVDFYLKRGFEIYDMKDNDYLMQFKIKKQ